MTAGIDPAGAPHHREMNPPKLSSETELESEVKGNFHASFGAGERLQSPTYRYNHQEHALCVMIRSGYLPALSVSRFNRRLHALASWLESALLLLGELFAKGEVFIIDSLPLPVCKRVRARRCKKVRGKAFCGYCAAKKEKFKAGACLWSVPRKASR